MDVKSIQKWVGHKDIDTTFSCIVDKISVEMIGPNEESIIVIEKRLES